MPFLINLYTDLNDNKVRKFLKNEKGKNTGFRLWRGEVPFLF